MERKTAGNRLLHYSARILVVFVAVGAGVLSFDGLRILAIAANINPYLAPVWALVVDGFILVATMAAFALKDRDLKTRWYPWAVLAIFVIISVIGNGWHAVLGDETYVLPTPVAVLVTAIPPVALFFGIHLLIVMMSPTDDEKAARRKAEEAQRRREAYELRKQETMERKQISLLELQLNQEIQEQKKKGAKTSQRNTTPPSLTAPDSPPAAVKGEKFSGLPEVFPEEKPAEPAKQPSAALKSVSGVEVSLIASNPSKTASKGGYAVAEVGLREKLSNGEGLPAASELAREHGVADRTAREWIKRFKDSNGLS